MKKSTISIEAIVLIMLLVFGLLGAKIVLGNDDNSPGLALPQQETPAVVMTPKEVPKAYAWENK